MNTFVEAFLNKTDLEKEFKDLSLSRGERETLIKTIEELARYKILNVVLDKLETKDKELFLRQLQSGSEEMLIETLREKIENVEGLLRNEIKEVEKDVLADISQIKDQT